MKAKTMNRTKFLTIFFTLLYALLAGSCVFNIDGDSSNPFNGNYFNYDLRGTWVSSEPDPVYSGGLEITYDRITVTGYGETQTPAGANDNRRPFRDFPKGVSFWGYSNDNKIFIDYSGYNTTGISYVLMETSIGEPDRLRFTFGNRYEFLKRLSD